MLVNKGVGGLSATSAHPLGEGGEGLGGSFPPPSGILSTISQHTLLRECLPGCLLGAQTTGSSGRGSPLGAAPPCLSEDMGAFGLVDLKGGGGRSHLVIWF